MAFKKDKYQVIADAISQDLAEYCCIQFQMMSDTAHYITNRNEREYFWADNQCAKSFSWYGSYWSESLLLMLKPLVEKVSGLILNPCYSYARIYYPGCVMVSHVDRPSCEISTSLNLGNLGDIWPIFFKTVNGKTKELKLPAGSMVVYRGCELEHWRDSMPDSVIKQYQVFLHYVDANGPYADYKFDKRPMLGFQNRRINEKNYFSFSLNCRNNSSTRY